MIEASPELTVSEWREADEEAVLSLLGRAFERWPNDLDVEPAAFFRWKHALSPFGPSTRLIARVDGEVAGFLALMPWRLAFSGEVYKTMRGVDLAVGPEFQRHGVARALIQAASDSYSGIAMSWSNPNHRSRSGVLKTGRKKVDGLGRYVGYGGVGTGGARRLVQGGAGSGVGASDESLAAALEDDALMERVLSDSNPEGMISTARDADFLRWRYGGPGGYRAVVSRDPRAGAGIAIFCIRRRGRFTVTRICELLTERQDRAALRELLRLVRRRAQTHFLVCAPTSPPPSLRCGLVRSNRTSMVAARPLRDGLRPDPTKASSWALSAGDLELI